MDAFLITVNDAAARTELGLGSLATLSAAPAGTLTGASLASGVLSSSLTSVGTLGSLSVSGMSALGMTSSTSATFPPLEAIRTNTATNTVSSAIRVTSSTTNDMADGFGVSLTFANTDSGASNQLVAAAAGVRAGADNTGNLVLSTYTAGVLGERFRATATGVLVTGTTSTTQIIDPNGVVTPVGTTGARTINAMSGSVNLAAAATSLVVTNSLVSTSSRVFVTVGTSDGQAKSCSVTLASGSFTIRPNAAPTGETRVDFLIIN